MQSQEELVRRVRRWGRRGRIRAVRKFIGKLNHIDPLPWNQAILLGVAATTMIIIAVLGNFAGY